MKKLHISLLVLAAFATLQADARGFFGRGRCNGGRCEDSCGDCRIVEDCCPTLEADPCACPEPEQSCKVWYETCDSCKPVTTLVPTKDVYECKEVCKTMCSKVPCAQKMCESELMNKFGSHLGKHNAVHQICTGNGNNDY